MARSFNGTSHYWIQNAGAPVGMTCWMESIRPTGTNGGSTQQNIITVSTGYAEFRLGATDGSFSAQAVSRDNPTTMKFFDGPFLGKPRKIAMLIHYNTSSSGGWQCWVDSFMVTSGVNSTNSWGNPMYHGANTTPGQYFKGEMQESLSFRFNVGGKIQVQTILDWSRGTSFMALLSRNIGGTTVPWPLQWYRHGGALSGTGATLPSADHNIARISTANDPTTTGGFGSIVPDFAPYTWTYPRGLRNGLTAPGGWASRIGHGGQPAARVIA